MIMKIVLFTLLCLFVNKNEAKSPNRAHLVRQSIANVLRNKPVGSEVVAFQYGGPFNKEETIARLPDNSTLIYEDIVGGFDCRERIYGYYGDMENDCRIFHLCYPLSQVFLDYHFTEEDIMHYVFICPYATRFNQVYLICDYLESALECSESDKFYNMNERFFKIPEKKEDDSDSEGEERYGKKTGKYRSS